MQQYKALSLLRQQFVKTAQEDRGIPEWMKIMGIAALGLGGAHFFKAHQVRKAMLAAQKARKMKLLAGLGLVGAGGAAVGANALFGGGGEEDKEPGLNLFGRNISPEALENFASDPHRAVHGPVWNTLSSYKQKMFNDPRSDSQDSLRQLHYGSAWDDLMEWKRTEGIPNRRGF